MESLDQIMEQRPLAPPAETGIPDVPSPQFALLNYFFPSYSMVTSVANAYIGADLNAYMPALISVIAILVLWNYVREQFWDIVNDHLRSSVTIRTDDEIYNMVMFWLSRQGFSHNSRHFVANTNVNSRYLCMYIFSEENSGDEDDDDERDANVNALTGASSSQKQALHYTPSFGTHFFWYKMRPLTFERVLNRDQNVNLSLSEKEELHISCFGRNPRILKELLLEARQLHMKRDDRKTVIFRANMAERYWQRCMSRLNRPLSTVILDEGVKKALIDDAADYLNPVTRRWYANRGIPYRRGYLLHGPPGTGKSSLSLSLAGFFRMKIYIISLNSSAATEDNLTALFHDLPTRCVVLLEDIDSAGLTHTREDSSAPSATPKAVAESSPTIVSSTPTSTGRVSLSGLLNILDGVASQEGRILIMTTNHVEKLDKALIRPGRIDMIVPFGLADSSMAASIFRAIYAPFDDETTLNADEEVRDVAVETRLAERRALISERVSEQARVFGESIPPLEFSPAEIQGLLLRHKRDPKGAIESVESWVVKMRKERTEKADEEAAKALREAEQRKKEQGAEQKKEEESDKEDEDATKGAVKLEPNTNKATKTASDSGYETP